LVIASAQGQVAFSPYHFLLGRLKPIQKVFSNYLILESNLLNVEKNLITKKNKHRSSPKKRMG